MSAHRNNSPGQGAFLQLASGGGQRDSAQQLRGGGRQGDGGKGGGDDRDRLQDLLSPQIERVQYFSAKDSTAPNADLLGSKAEDEARKLASVPTSQLRRFYGEVMALKRRAELTSISDAEIVAQMMLLRAKAAYTSARQSYPDELVDFFNRHAHSVKTKQDFLYGFQPHFEAVMAFHNFYKVFEKKGKPA